MCPFKEEKVREVIAACLKKLDGAEDGYALDAFVVMPNHVHVLVSPRDKAELSEICRTWKSVTAHEVNKLLGRSGPLWQQESWDRIVRSPEHLEKYRRYIRENPLHLPKVE